MISTGNVYLVLVLVPVPVPAHMRRIVELLDPTCPPCVLAGTYWYVHAFLTSSVFISISDGVHQLDTPLTTHSTQRTILGRFFLRARAREFGETHKYILTPTEQQQANQYTLTQPFHSFTGP